MVVGLGVELPVLLLFDQVLQIETDTPAFEE